jgi:hypothetical protein
MSNARRPNAPPLLHARRVKTLLLKRPKTVVAQSPIADHTHVSPKSVPTSHQLVPTTKTALPLKSLSAAAHTLASVTSPSATISVKPHVQKDIPDTLLTPTIVVQLLDAAQLQQHQSLQLSHIQHTHTLQLHPSQPLALQPRLPHQLRLPLLSHQKHTSALSPMESPDSTVKSGQFPIASHVAVLPLAQSNAQLKNAPNQHHVPKTNTSQLNTMSAHAARVSVALQMNALIHVLRSLATRSNNQLVPVTKMSSQSPSIQTAAATTTTVNATRTSATKSEKLHAQLVTLDKLSIPMLAAQLPSVAQHLQQLDQPRPLHTLLQLSQQQHSHQPLTSQHQLSVLVLIEKVVNDNMVNHGLTKNNHV